MRVRPAQKTCSRRVLLAAWSRGFSGAAIESNADTIAANPLDFGGLLHMAFAICKWNLDIHKSADLYRRESIEGEQRTASADILNNAAMLTILNP